MKRNWMDIITTDSTGRQERETEDFIMIFEVIR